MHGTGDSFVRLSYTYNYYSRAATFWVPSGLRRPLRIARHDTQGSHLASSAVAICGPNSASQSGNGSGTSSHTILRSIRLLLTASSCARQRASNVISHRRVLRAVAQVLGRLPVKVGVRTTVYNLHTAHRIISPRACQARRLAGVDESVLVANLIAQVRNCMMPNTH